MDGQKSTRHSWEDREKGTAETRDNFSLPPSLHHFLPPSLRPSLPPSLLLSLPPSLPPSLFPSLSNYIVLAMSESLQEIIRVLQLTSPTEEQGAFAAAQGADQVGLPGGLLPGSLAARIFQAKELVSQTGQLQVKGGLHRLLSHSLLGVVGQG